MPSVTCKDGRKRCPWAKDAYDRAYHDTEWCHPCHNDALLFELLILEGMQAGLSWNLILKRREGMRAALDGFDYRKIATYNDDKKAELLQDPRLIRNRAKINAVVGNARAFMEIQAEYGSFDKYIWAFTKGKVLNNRLTDTGDMPASTPLSETVSGALRKRGFRFVGPTICYSYLQAIGVVNDHLTDCDFYKEH